MTRWNYTKGAHDLGNGAYAYLQPDEGSGWGWSNGGLIVDGKELLLVDTLRDEKLTKAMLDALRDATGLAAKDIGKLVNTHKDGDHWFGNRLMAHADIIASEATAEAMKHGDAGAVPQRARRTGRRALSAITSSRFTARRSTSKASIRSAPSAPSPARCRSRSATRTCILIEVGPAHTEGDTLVHVPANKTVYTGDIVFLDVTPVIWAGPAENWLAAIDRILAMDVETVVPGHGPITDKNGGPARARLSDLCARRDAQALRRRHVAGRGGAGHRAQ